MQANLHGRHALVTGGGTGVGAAIAVALAQAVLRSPLRDGAQNLCRKRQPGTKRYIGPLPM